MIEAAFDLKPYIQPFERRVAFEELRGLIGSLSPSDDGENHHLLHLPEGVDVAQLARSLAYWERVHVDGATYVTSQVRYEASSAIARNGSSEEELLAVDSVDGVVPGRRTLRYGPHGIHEYRGKFFPQLVRGFLNATRSGPGSVVADPMAGSGTTLVEAAAAGCEAFGLDLNPLSVFVARTKCDLLSADPRRLFAVLEDARSHLAGRATDPDLPYLRSLTAADQRYLEAWFDHDRLAELDQVAQWVADLEAGPAQNLARVSLSNILRRASRQREDDLRIRKESERDPSFEVVSEFLDEFRKSVRSVSAYLAQRGTTHVGRREVQEGDARELNRLWAHLAGRVDLIVTSPPYATALPYLDTDRLSLVYLGLLSRAEHRDRDTVMIGNREITNRERTAYLDAYDAARTQLPTSVVATIDEIRNRNDVADVGFRRRNVAPLLGKYFTDMRSVLAGMWTLLRPGGTAIVVVGSNHTVAGGHRVEIRTADLLADLAVDARFTVDRTIPMEMLVSRDIFRRNASNAETILVLTKAS